MTDIPATTALASQASGLVTMGSQAAPNPGPAEPGAAGPSRATFDVLPLSREVRETLAEIGYTHPTPVQIAVWEPATRGKDAVVQARTGTGKTAAFGLPIVDHVVRRSAPQVQVLALCPTRELALQVSNEVERLGKRRNVKVLAIYGGAPMQRQIDQIAAGAQVVIGTPGRVLDHLRRGTLDARHVRMLVLDEADEMLSMGFEREVTAILDALPKERQTLLFSATLPPDIERMAKKLHAPEFVTLSGDHVGALEIEHFVYMVASDKIGALVRVIDVENPESAVVFCNTKDETERVAQTLVRHGYDADWLNGDLPQESREKVMSATREGRLRFLVATDVAARGIDISHLTHVINYDFPQDAEAYVHRTGRTGRAGRTGTAISLIMPQDVGGLYLLRLTYKIRPIEKQIPTEGELKTRAEADLVSMLVEAFGSRTVHPDDLALARRVLTHENGEMIFAGMLRDHLGARPTAQQEASAARRATKVAPQPAPTRTLVSAAAPQTEPRTLPRAPANEPRVPHRNEAPEPARAVPRAEAPEASEPREKRAPFAPEAPLRTPPRAEPVEAPSRAAARPDVAEAPPRAPLRHDLPERAAPEAAPSRPRAPQPSPRFDARGDERRDTRGDDRRDERRDDRRDDRRDEPRGDRRGRRPEGPSRRPRPDGLPRDEHMPVSAAEGSREGAPEARHPQRHADFSTWQPPEEEGDDEPILRNDARIDAPRERDARPDRPRRDRPREGAPAMIPPVMGAPAMNVPAMNVPAMNVPAMNAPAMNAPAISSAAIDVEPRPFPRPDVIEARPAARADAPAEGEGDGDFVEIYVNVGRREGARAADFQRILMEKAAIDRAHVRRIRVRERNAFVSVRREDLANALGALSGASIAGKTAMAEQARERGAGEGEAPMSETVVAAAPVIEGLSDDPTMASAPDALTVDEAVSDGPVSSDGVPTGRSVG